MHNPFSLKYGMSLWKKSNPKKRMKNKLLYIISIQMVILLNKWWYILNSYLFLFLSNPTINYFLTFYPTLTIHYFMQYKIFLRITPQRLFVKEKLKEWLVLVTYPLTFVSPDQWTTNPIKIEPKLESLAVLMNQVAIKRRKRALTSGGNNI